MHPHPQVFFPSAREAPPDVLRVLRAIDDKVVVVWLRRGAWLLGSHIPNRDRMKGATSTLAKLHESSLASLYASKATFEKAVKQWGDRVAVSRLRAQGVVEHKTFDANAVIENDLWGQVETWLRYAKWIQQNAYEHYWRQMEADQVRNDDEERKITDTLDRARLREAYRMGFKAPVSRGWTRELEKTPIPA